MNFPKVCVGVMNFGARTPAPQAQKIVDRAFDLGIPFFDTANFYGDGESERVLAGTLKGRRSHVGRVWLCVHDDFQRRGIGAALVTALIDAADNWLNLRRLELTVYVDNEAAIRLYEKFGFEIEGRRRSDCFRDGLFVDSYAMARLHALP